MIPTIVDFRALAATQIAGAAAILREALAHLPSAYNAPGKAEAEIELRRDDAEWLGYAALIDGEPAGWIGASKTYSHAWEIHPLVVLPSRQRRGIGSALLAHLEERGRAAGILTLYLGSDDDYGGTTLHGRPLFPGVAGHMTAVETTARGHALSFYRQHGYEIVGLVPDANGPGHPDILMAKPLRP